ncbi:MAG: hypothetical protein M1837_000789 [Sclerophora amabilis]|nr:MAG: hypothetical protein M1837_000789 [Sclerophora amabilis]
MSTKDEEGGESTPRSSKSTPPAEGPASEKARGWRSIFKLSTGRGNESSNEKPHRDRWTMGLLNDRETDEVPGSILLLSSDYNEPLGLQNAPAPTSSSSLPSPYPGPSPPRPPEKKKTSDGQIVLDPQPDDSLNDPLNWPAWKRDVALLSLGFYCMVGGGMTPILAAGFEEISEFYDVTIPQVALTTGLYMLGLGVGSVVSSPTAILFGKRPVYLVGIILFLLSSVWCALSPNYASLVVARVVQGIAVSPCESLPSATIAEIFFLHERAYRIGVYTLLLLGGKNLIPLVSAAIIQGLDWQWVFWIVAIVVGFCFVLLFFFVPETFWDRTPRPKLRTTSSDSHPKISSVLRHIPRTPQIGHSNYPTHDQDLEPAIEDVNTAAAEGPGIIAHRRRHKIAHVGWGATEDGKDAAKPTKGDEHSNAAEPSHPNQNAVATPSEPLSEAASSEIPLDEKNDPKSEDEETSDAANVGIPLSGQRFPASPSQPLRYTTELQSQPRRTFTQTLRPWNGRLRKDNWFHVACRPFILFAYPAVLWSTVVYSLSVGWLIVLSESVTVIYGHEGFYNFSPLSTGLIYLSPFIGGVLGTAVAGKVSDIIVRYMSRRNGGLYEPEFRLVMAIPVAITTCIGLMGYGWSAQERDRWIVPTVFFGIISFGCSLGSTTAITFCVDSYRQYAGEALVTLNFSKNIFHGLVFSLFFNRWLEADGSKDVFVALGGIQLVCLLFTIPMYIYGKRMRMWTVRKNLMEKF